MFNKIVIERGSSCSTPKTFLINGKSAYLDDFGYMEDKDPTSAPELGCGDMTFTAYDPKQFVLESYGITISEYETICEKLAVEMHIGRCGWCA